MRLKFINPGVGLYNLHYIFIKYTAVNWTELNKLITAYVFQCWCNLRTQKTLLVQLCSQWQRGNSKLITRPLLELMSELEVGCVPGDLHCSVVVDISVDITVLDDVSSDVSSTVSCRLCPLHCDANSTVTDGDCTTEFGQQTVWTQIIAKVLKFICISICND